MKLLIYVHEIEIIIFLRSFLDCVLQLCIWSPLAIWDILAKSNLWAIYPKARPRPQAVSKWIMNCVFGNHKLIFRFLPFGPFVYSGWGVEGGSLRDGAKYGKFLLVQYVQKANAFFNNNKNDLVCTWLYKMCMEVYQAAQDGLSPDLPWNNLVVRTICLWTLKILETKQPQ